MITPRSISISLSGKVASNANSINKSAARRKSSFNTVACSTISSFVVYAFNSPPQRSRYELITRALLRFVPLNNACSTKCAVPSGKSSSPRVPPTMVNAQ